MADSLDFFTVAAYKAIDGDCGGNDIAKLRVTREQCAAKCTSTANCAGWGYVVAGTRKWPHASCYMKKKMCEKPVLVKGLSITSYFKAKAGESVFPTIQDICSY